VIKENIKDALNKQINAELYSAYLYLSMSAYFSSINLKGFASWMRVQAREEFGHAMKFFDYLQERGGRVKLTAIQEPPSDWEFPLQLFEQVYEHEQKVTAMIDELVNIAQSEKDHATNNFLQWFVAEQVEEESSADEIVQRLKLIKDTKSGLFMLDQKLGQRPAK